MIKLEKVNKYFNHHHKNEIHVINNTSLELPDSGLIALLGPSGCGKTTLLNAIGGLDKVKKGKIYINNKRITRKSAYQKDKMRNLNIGYIFQNYYLIDNKTVFDNVAISLQMIGIKNKKEIAKRVNKVLEILGIYRYRNRLASMLSGGERQRVGIARAIVKNPSIIIADEPTGNLDSNNSIEIMNIIKSISKTRLVILVTHENNLAKFYADRIIELEDGKVIKDYVNKNSDNLDYKINNKFYLKDFKNITNFSNKDNEINIYNDKQNDLKLTIVVKNNNIFIKGTPNSKIEIVDSDSNIEFINDHYKEIDKSIYEKYEFKYNEEYKNEKPKYSSIFRLGSYIYKGFQKILDYSFLKKILLLGFFASGAFIAYSICNIFGILKVEDSAFVIKHHDYYDVSVSKLSSEKYEEYLTLEGIDYILPGNSDIKFKMELPYYYQTTDVYTEYSGSLASIDKINKKDLIFGKMPENEYELVVDEMTLQKLIDGYIVKQIGLDKVEDFLNQELKLKNLNTFKIVGIVSKQSPTIYANKSLFINMLYNSFEEYYDDDIINLVDNNLINNLEIYRGRLPEKAYEVVVNKDYIYDYPLNKKIDYKVNGKKLTVVGYYSNKEDYYVVNEKTLEYSMLEKSKKLSIMPLDKNVMNEQFSNVGIHPVSSYENSLKTYKQSRSSEVKAGIIVGAIIIAISFVEIILMVRASFLSRIKEIGIYRAIGVKKSDIYKMFYGEIFAISTVACVPGVLLVSYALNTLQTIDYFAENYLINIFTILFSLIVIYIINGIIGLIPVANVMRKTPAQILSRKDLD